MLKRTYSSIILTVFIFTFLIGCNSTQSNNVLVPELLDTVYPNYIEQAIETEKEIFGIDESMISFVAKNIADQPTVKGKITKLVRAIFDRTQLSLSYKAGANTTAIQTFNSGAANCLSLTIMTYAMTEHLGMKSEFQDIKIPEFWTRRDGNTLINQHINLKVLPAKTNRYILTRAATIVDFDPQQGMLKFSATSISKSQMVSYFYVNKAADYMINNEPTIAYAYLRAAIKEDPRNDGAWLNLGVLSSQNNLYQQAQTYYEKALSLRPAFTSAYENLALLYSRQGQDQKAQSLLNKLHQKRLKNPYYHMVKGDIAIESHDYNEAIKHYKEAISLNNRPHEFHFNIAKAYYYLGDLKNAQRYLEKAKRRAGDDQLSERYGSKISTLIATR